MNKDGEKFAANRLPPFLTEYSAQMSFEGLQDGHFDLPDALPEELLGCCVEQLVGLHDLALGDAGDGQGHAVGGLDAFAHRVQGHHLERQALDVRDEPPCPCPASHDGHALRRTAASS